MKMDISIGDNARREISQNLKAVLGDTYVLYLKTHAFHWNVVGPRFAQLHSLFEQQYRALWESLDEIAERIRSLGEFAPNSGGEMVKAASLKETAGDSHGDMDMIKALLADNEAIIKTVRKAHDAAEKGGDEATVDLMVERLGFHEKTAWMLRAHLG
jgi:starvation-inducible DNA-binding protein